jgi:outer membrane protein TolC
MPGGEANPDNRVEVQTMDATRELIEMNIRRLRSGHLPTLSLFANYEYAAQRAAFDFFDASQPWFQSASWGVSLKVPIFDSFQKSAGIQKEKTNLQVIMNTREQLRQSILLESLQASTSYANASEQLATQTKNLQLAEKIMNTAQLKYAEGVGSSLEVNSAQATLLQTQTAYINALYELLIAKTDLEKALGIL